MKSMRSAGLGALTVLAFFGGATAALAHEGHLTQTDVFIGGQDHVFEYRIPALVTTKQGSLLAICDARVERAGDPPNYIRAVMKRSTDGGRTWGPLRTVADPGRGAIADSCAVVDRQTGTIWVFSDYCPDGIGSGNAIRGISGGTVYYKAVHSDDDGLTWSQPQDFTPALKKPEWRSGSFGPGRGIQLRSGRLVMPRYYYTSSDTDKKEYGNGFVSYSDDHGRTWKIGQDAKTLGETNECQVAEMADGSLLLNMRGIVGNHRRIARSTDGGETWSAVTEDPALLEPRCMAGLVSYADTSASARDRLLFSNPASLKRDHLTVKLSYDAGRTWSASKLLHAGPAAYSCLTILPDLTIGCLYERGDKKPYERITFAHFDLEYLTDGKDSAGATR